MTQLEPPGWGVLLTERGASLLQQVALGRLEGRSSQQIGSMLRTQGVAPDEVSAVLGQADLRSKATAKFGPLAERMLFTQAGLEQASRAPVSALHAARFIAAGCSAVADLGCGIGSESIALAAAGIAAHPIEIDPFTARIAAHNLQAAGFPTPVATGDAERSPLATEVDGVFLDPARRTSGHRDTRRLTSPDDYSPSLSFAFSHAERLPVGVKLGPGFDRDLIPAGAEAQWVSVDGHLVEMGLWFGAAAQQGVRRSALVMRNAHAYELAASDDAPDAETRPLGGYIYEPDGAVIRARLIGTLAGQLTAGMLGEKIAYLTSDTLTETPFATAFRVDEALPFKEKALARALRERGIGTLEIKKRGVDVDPAALRARLALRGTRTATLLLTRVAGKHTALLVTRA